MRQNKLQNYVWILAIGSFCVSLLMGRAFGFDGAERLFLGVLLLVISIIDYRYFIIPDELLMAGLLGYGVYSLAGGAGLGSVLASGLFHGILASVPLLLFVLLADWITRTETMGFGDIKLFFLLGVYLGAVKTWLTLFLACVAGLVWYFAKQIAQKYEKKNLEQKQNRKQNPEQNGGRGEAFPFGPSIAIAAGLTMLWGDNLLEWYMTLLL